MSDFTGTQAVFKREFKGYFATPLGYIFIVIFLISAGYLTVSRDYGQFLELRQASLDSFFTYIPWIFVVLVPAVAMRLWADERKTGTIELLFTLPITLKGSYLGKFLAGWVFLLVALALTFPLVYQVSRLGNPDWGTLFTGYLGCALLAATFLAIGMLFSAITKNQVVAFILGVSASVIFLVIGLPQSLQVLSNGVYVGCALAGILTGIIYFGVARNATFALVAGILVFAVALFLLPGAWTNALGSLLGGYPEQLVGSLSLTDHFSSLTRGLLELRALAFFILITCGWLFCGMMLLDRVKAS